MLNDMVLATETAKQFESYCEANPEKCKSAGKIELKVTTLTQGHWPSMLVFPELHLPSVLSSCCDVYNEFFTLKNNMRKITWVLSQGAVFMKASFSQSKVYDIEMAPLQAIVMLAFNRDSGVPVCSTSGAISFSELQKTYNMPEDILKKILHSLSCMKLKLLKKDGEESNGKDKASNVIRPTDSFLVNDKFSNNVKRFKIPIASLTERNESKLVEDSRNIAIEAAVVRIMKVSDFSYFHFFIKPSLN